MKRIDRGSALIVVVLVTAVLTLVGLSFLLLASTENRIAENEKLSAQALYFAEGGARVVIRWFDRPRASGPFQGPLPDEVDRTRRRIDEDGDPSTAPHGQDGTTWPRYKQGSDRDGDGRDDLFDRPYRAGLRDPFLGTEDGPDLRIDRQDGARARAFLERLSESMMPGFPAAHRGLRAQIARIDVYAPPHLLIGGQWIRYGIATVKVVGRIYLEREGEESVLAERVVKTVLNEVPYSLSYGPLHSCGSVALSGPLPVHWGAVTAAGDIVLDPDHSRTPASLARAVSASAGSDLLWGSDDDSKFATYRVAIEGLRVEDPWLRVLAGGILSPSASADPQPHPFLWDGSHPLGEGEIPSHAPGMDGSHSNLFQAIPGAGCPEWDYELWKSIATSGRDTVAYYVWDSDDRFRRDGIGPSLSFRSITDLDPADSGEKPLVYFFDTQDGSAPHDDDGDQVPDNLTPDITVDGGTWGTRGVIYLNARSFRLAGSSGRPGILRAPGEPYQDRNQNGRWDPGEDWINLQYPATLGGTFFADAGDASLDDGAAGTFPVRNAVGPPVPSFLSLDGVLFSNGLVDLSGSGVVFGSVVSRGGVMQSDPANGSPDIYWNQLIREGGWPPGEWGLPRVLVTRWQTDF